MNILFVCRHNRFRSRFAENYFKNINKNKSIKTQSAGIFPGEYPLNKLEKFEAKKLEVNIEGKPQPVTTKLLRWANLIVVVANDIPTKKLFTYSFTKGKFIVWKIKDRYGGKEDIQKIYKKIKENVDKLNKVLENGRIK